MGRRPFVSRITPDMKEKYRDEEEVEKKDIFLPSGSLNTKPPTLLLLLL